MLDENIDVELANLLVDHEVMHVNQLGWKSVTNGKLLQLAEENQFEAFITADKNMPYQQSMKGRPFPLVVLDIHPNNFENLAACVPELTKELGSYIPSQIYLIEGPHPKRARPDAT